MKNILVTGGAGYIGSHMVWALLDAGYETVVVLDNLSVGEKSVVAEDVIFYQGNVGNSSLVQDILKKHQIDAVFHFAALTSVNDSMQKADLYNENNYQQTVKLIDEAVAEGVKTFVFSSTAAVYAPEEAAKGSVREDGMVAPVSPYGESKLKVERYLQDIVTQYERFNAGILRYFNVVGADAKGRTGLHVHGESLCHKINDVVMGKADVFRICGNDYETIDGTGVRDFIHVSDLVDAHLALAQKIEEKEQSYLLNCGYGQGFSVLDVVKAYEEVLEKKLPIDYLPRREGDLGSVIADTSLIEETLDWEPQYKGKLKNIVETNCQWILRHSPHEEKGSAA